FRPWSRTAPESSGRVATGSACPGRYAAPRPSTARHRGGRYRYSLQAGARRRPAPGQSLSRLFQTVQPLRFVFCTQSIDKLAEPAAFEHLIELMQGQVDAMIRHPSLREVVGSDPLRAIAGTDHRLAGSGALAGETLPLHLEQSRPQHLQRLGLVLVLRLLVLLDDDEARRKVGNPHRAVGRIDGLATR